MRAPPGAADADGGGAAARAAARAAADFFDAALQHPADDAAVAPPCASARRGFADRAAAGDALRRAAEAAGVQPRAPAARDADAYYEAGRVFCALEDRSALHGSFSWRDEMPDA